MWDLKNFDEILERVKDWYGWWFDGIMSPIFENEAGNVHSSVNGVRHHNVLKEFLWHQLEDMGRR